MKNIPMRQIPDENVIFPEISFSRELERSII